MQAFYAESADSLEPLLFTIRDDLVVNAHRAHTFDVKGDFEADAEDGLVARSAILKLSHC